jgi:chemotaxis protein histidine kinase CheA
MSSNEYEEQFLEEVFGLFALEAQEWITQCKTALLELENSPSADRQAKLYEIIICGITNLGGSAATVELPALEKLAFAVVALLQTMRQSANDPTSEQLAALHGGLHEITQAVEHLEDTKSGGMPGLENTLRRLAAAADHQRMVQPIVETTLSSVAEPAKEPAASPLPPEAFLQALRDLEQTDPKASGQTRHVAGAVISRINGGREEHNGSHADATTIMRILKELDAHDEQFLAELSRRLPIIHTFLGGLKGQTQTDRLDVQAEAVAQDIHVLHEAAHALEAKTIMSFFHGLQTFLAVLSRKEVPVHPQRFETIAARLQSMLPLAQEWVDIGRHERAVIQQILHV